MTTRSIIAWAFVSCAFVLFVTLVLNSLYLTDNRFSLTAGAALVELRIGDTNNGDSFTIESLKAIRLEAHEIADAKSGGTCETGPNDNYFAAHAEPGGQVVLDSLSVKANTRMVIAIRPDGVLDLAFPEGRETEKSGVESASVVVVQARSPCTYEFENPEPGFSLSLTLHEGEPVRFHKPVPVKGLSFIDASQVRRPEGGFSTLRHGVIQFDLGGQPGSPRLLREGERLEFHNLVGYVRRLVVYAPGSRLQLEREEDEVVRLRPETGSIELQVVATARDVHAGFAAGEMQRLTPSCLERLMANPIAKTASGTVLAIIIALVGIVIRPRTGAEPGESLERDKSALPAAATEPTQPTPAEQPAPPPSRDPAA